jgi:hypothetical protein
VIEDLAQMSEDLLKDGLEYVGQADPEVVVVFVHSVRNSWRTNSTLSRSFFSGAASTTTALALRASSSFLLQVLASPSLFEDPKLIVIEDLAQMSEDLLKDGLVSRSFFSGAASTTTALALRASSSFLPRLPPECTKTGYTPGQLQVLASPSLFEDPKLIVIEDLAQMSEVLQRSGIHHDRLGPQGVEQLLAAIAARVHEDHHDPARALTQAVGNSTSELASACSQLLSDGPEHITFDVVETYYGGRVEATTCPAS